MTAYAVHNHASYLDVDRALADDATHFASVLEAQRLEGTPHGIPPSLPAESRTLVRSYDSRGEPLIDAGSGVPPPPIDATQTLAEDAGPLYDRVVRWLPGGSGGGSGLLALWWKCPHLGCMVPWRVGFDYEGDKGWYRCPCHGSTYTRAGIRVFGPAPRSMDTMEIEIDDDGNVTVQTGRITPGGPDNPIRAVQHPLLPS